MKSTLFFTLTIFFCYFLLVEQIKNEARLGSAGMEFQAPELDLSETAARNIPHWKWETAETNKALREPRTNLDRVSPFQR